MPQPTRALERPLERMCFTRVAEVKNEAMRVLYERKARRTRVLWNEDLVCPAPRAAEAKDGNSVRGGADSSRKAALYTPASSPM